MQMNPIFKVIAAAAILCTSPAGAITVLLDPGHGGKDAGAVQGQAKESEIVLQFSKLLEAELKAKGYEAILTRDSDQFTPQKDREHYANDVRASVVISLHLATTKDTEQRGIRIYRAPEAEDAGLLYEQKELPAHIAKALSEKAPETPVESVRMTKPLLNDKKAILIELAHLSNDEDRKLIQDPAYQLKLAKTLAEAINDLY